MWTSTTTREYQPTVAFLCILEFIKVWNIAFQPSMRTFFIFSGPPARVQKSSAVELFLNFGLEKNLDTYGLQMSSFYLNLTCPVRVKISEKKVTQWRNTRPPSIQQIYFFPKGAWLHSYLFDPTGFQTKPIKSVFTNTIALPYRCGNISSVCALFLSITTYYQFTAQIKFDAPLSAPDK